MHEESHSSRRHFLAAAGVGALGLASLPSLAVEEEKEILPGIPQSQKYPENQSSLTVSDPSRIKVLQFTDIHFFCSRDKYGVERDERTVEDFKRLVDHAEPDILAVTGDTWHDNPEGRGREFQEFAVAKIGALGIPTLYTWGNHDRLDDYVAGHDRFAEAPHSLYRGGIAGGNYTVDLLNKDGKRVWEFVCLNTTDVGLKPLQWRWLEDLKKKKLALMERQVPLLCFLHIPLLQYYYLWHEEFAAGFKLEDVCSWEENGGGLWKVQDLGPVRAFFCGHDHVNDYSGVVEGSELVYGRATGHAGYGWDKVRKGAKLITLNAESGSYVWQTLFADGTTWVPEQGMHLEEVVDAPWMRWKES
jgi:hypothetical protein